ncbi:MAG: hypothetical protein QOC96_1374 [Acidobacteriota bacterium]|nr:hypothetical protein [Acidobacteriota bacterium]
MITMKRTSFLAACCAVVLLFSLGQLLVVTAHVDAGSIKGTVRATTAAANTAMSPIPGARLTLFNRDLPNNPIKTTTNEAGDFVFTGLPAATYILTVEATGLPTVTREIQLADGANLNVEIELTATVSESVTVRDEEGLVSTAETTTSNTVRERTLKNVPLRAENYQSALPLTPGVVRGANGEDHIKGASAGQSAYTVNGADVTDPVTGKLAFDIPIEAAASVQIEENPYSAEFGRLTGGATNLETKGGDNKFKFRAARFFPAFRYILAGPIDSFRPRVTFSGPIIRDRLFFLQSFEYRFTRVRVPSLVKPHDDSTSEAFNSFTQLDLTVNKNNRIKFVASVFPQKSNYAGLNTFNPQETTPNIKQHGSLFSISEQAIFNDASFLSSALSYKSFDVDVYAQGAQPLTLAPDGNTGNYFADSRRQTGRWQWQETYYARALNLFGQHSFKIGGEYDRTSVSGRFTDNTIFIRRANGTLAQRIDFAGPSTIALQVAEMAAFVQDRWVVSKSLTFDVGVRFDRDGLAKKADLAPRLSFLFLPFRNDRTIIRGGIGLFYDRTPLSAGYFGGDDGSLEDADNDNVSTPVPVALAPSALSAQLPERVVTTFAANGLTPLDGPRLFRNRISTRLRDPRSVRWSVQLERAVSKNLVARISYLQRSTTNELIVRPHVMAPDWGTFRLSSRGRSQYRELQMLAVYSSPRLGNWNASYVWSSARGDLNTADNFLTDLPAFVIRPNQYGPLSFDAPHRFLIYGQKSLPHDINISPALEIRSGFPYSIVNEQLDFVGARNEAGRFPTFLSLDAQITKGFRVPGFENHKMRVGVAVFNITRHFNPRDVQNNLGSTHFGQFYNSQGLSVRGKFELDF